MSNNMKRGEIWMVSGGVGHVGKPRPAVILQNNIHPDIKSITICLLLADIGETSVPRPIVDPNSSNGIRVRSVLMVDQITTVPRTKMGNKIGDLGEEDMAVLNRAASDFLGLADSPANP